MTTMGSQTNTHSLRSQRARGDAADDIADATATAGNQDSGDGEWCGYCGDDDCRCAALRFSPRTPRA